MVKKDKFVINFKGQSLTYYEARKLAMQCGFEVRTHQVGKNRVLQIRASERSQFLDVHDWVDNHLTNIRQRALEAVERAERLGLTGIGESVQKSKPQPGGEGVVQLILHANKLFDDYLLEYKASKDEGKNMKFTGSRVYACAKTLAWMNTNISPEVKKSVFSKAVDSVFMNG